MKKAILVAALSATFTTCLASCGDKGSFKIATSDPVLSLTDAKRGFDIYFDKDSKFVQNPAFEDIKWTCDSKVQISPKRFNVEQPFEDVWTAKINESGTYVVTMSINGFKSDLTLTVKEGQFADQDFLLPDNIQITYQTQGSESTRTIYKIGKKVLSVGQNNRPEIYIPNVDVKGYYGNSSFDEEPKWEKRTSSPKNAYDNIFGRFMLRETGEYSTKEVTKVQIDGKEYTSTVYTYFDTAYSCIKTDTISIVHKLTGDYYLSFELKSFNTDITSIPPEFVLPE